MRSIVEKFEIRHGITTVSRQGGNRCRFVAESQPKRGLL
jgi:hypothetical protein